MKEPQGLIQTDDKGVPGGVAIPCHSRVVTAESGFAKLQAPVAELMPEEIVYAHGRLFYLKGLKIAVDLKCD